MEDYAYRTYAYHDYPKGGPPTPDGAYIVLNNDADGAAEIEYGGCRCVWDVWRREREGGLIRQCTRVPLSFPPKREEG